jgi:hypothetical protein
MITLPKPGNLLNGGQFGFRANHSTTLQCMRLTDLITLNFNNKMSTAAVFLDNEKAFDTLWHPGLLYKLSTMEFSTNLLKLTSSFPSMSGGVPVLTAWRILGLQMEEWPPAENILNKQLGGWAWG